MDEADTGVIKTDNQRKQILAIEVGNLVAQGYRVESQSDFQAVLARGSRPNHTLHAILMVFTLFLWAVVWIILSLTKRVDRVVVTVDEWGNLRHQGASAS